MVRQKLEHFSIEQICASGQCFRMERKNENTYAIIAKDKYLEVSQCGGETVFYCGTSEFEGFWKRYFDLEEDYHAYIQSIDPKDNYLISAAGAGSGIRILRQDLWEMIVSFLISQQNNIVRIRRCIQNLCEEYGQEMEGENGARYFAFPEPEALAALDEDALKACNLGYRSKYVVRAAQSVVSGDMELSAAAVLSYPEAKAELLKLFGVGEKVADCICLFALHKTEVFPVDTHINQALKQHYKKGFPKRRYKGFQGIMQQYIFYYELHKNRTAL